MADATNSNWWTAGFFMGDEPITEIETIRSMPHVIAVSEDDADRGVYMVQFDDEVNDQIERDGWFTATWHGVQVNVDTP